MLITRLAVSSLLLTSFVAPTLAADKPAASPSGITLPEGYIDGTMGYALSGELSQKQLLTVAETVYRQLNS